MSVIHFENLRCDRCNKYDSNILFSHIVTLNLVPSYMVKWRLPLHPRDVAFSVHWKTFGTWLDFDLTFNCTSRHPSLKHANLPHITNLHEFLIIKDKPSKKSCLIIIYFTLIEKSIKFGPNSSQNPTFRRKKIYQNFIVMVIWIKWIHMWSCGTNYFIKSWGPVNWPSQLAIFLISNHNFHLFIGI